MKATSVLLKSFRRRELSTAIKETESRLDVLENKLLILAALEEFRVMEGPYEFPKEYDHSKAVEANTLRSLKKNSNVQKSS